MRKTIVMYFVLIFALSLCSCANPNRTTGSDVEATASSAVTSKSDGSYHESDVSDFTARNRGVTVSSYDDIDLIYQFELNGKHYSLPCEISDFLDNGDTIPEHDLAYTVPANHTVGQITVHPDGNESAKIELTVLNDTEHEMSVQECNKVVGVTVREDANVSFVLSSGIDIMDSETMIADLQDYYGTDESIYSETGDAFIWHFYRRINHEYDGAFDLGAFPGMDEIRVGDSFYMEYAGRPDNT